MKIEQIFRQEMKNTLGEHILFGNSEEDNHKAKIQYHE